jgi:hypothetical protein
MNGQWIGTYTVTNYPPGITGPGGGHLILDIDERREWYEGVAHLNYGVSGYPFPPMDIWFRSADKQPSTDLISTQISIFDNGKLVSWDAIKDKYPGVTQPGVAKGRLTLQADGLQITWTTDIGTEGHASLPKPDADKPSELQAQIKDWSEYKEYVNQFEGRGRLFRGQNRPWRLRTSFHRMGRANLLRYGLEDLQALHRILSARTKHFFNLANNQELWAFLNLAQHHGYPTPLLDWSYSPYVAAFFAFRGINGLNISNDGNKVRILVFEHERWRSQFPQIDYFAARFSHVSLVEPVALENERYVPQQSASTHTTLDDIETYMATKAAEAKQPPYLSAIDLPWSERDTVLRDLHYMGITAGSMFPGLDGACEELKERNFLML